MTDLQQLADELAVACGWEKAPLGPPRPYLWRRVVGDTEYQSSTNPFPVGDLSALEAAWPEGWWISIGTDDFSGWKWRGCAGRGFDDDDELDVRCDTCWEAWARLLLAVKRASTPA